MSDRSAPAPLLRVSSLSTHFALEDGDVRRAVDDVSFDVDPGRVVGIVGESGSGKSVTALSVLRLVDEPGRIVSGGVEFEGEDVLAMSRTQLARLRGGRIGTIFQEPMRSMNPVFTIGRQLTETIREHGAYGDGPATRREADRIAVSWLGRVGLPNPERVFGSYPHELSGGMLQRAMIAMALSCNPKLLIADEPTTALDVTVQAQILDLIVDLKDDYGLGVLLITHDLGVIAEVADDVVVMRGGRVVETAPVGALFESPQHPYTRALLGAVPVLTPRDEAAPEAAAAAADADASEPLVEATALVKRFDVRRGLTRRGSSAVTAVDEVSLRITRGESVGIVGESGSGKTTIGQTLLRMQRPTSGTVRLEGRDLFEVPARELRTLRPRIQYIFQDPYSALNPRLPIADAIGEPLVAHGLATKQDVRDRVTEALEMCGMPASALDRFPHQFSGGQRQRIVIARAMALRPAFVVADEPVSALDVSVRAQIIDLFRELQAGLGTTFLLISHDLSIVEQLCERIVVMRDGAIVEEGPTGEILRHPREAYTRSLIDAVPVPDPRRRRRGTRIRPQDHPHALS